MRPPRNHSSTPRQSGREGQISTRSPVPETGALSTRPLPVKLVGMRGFEPPPPCPQDRWAPVTLHPENLERSAGIEPAPRHWQCRILPLNHDRPNLVEAEGDDPSLPVCRTGVLPIRRRPQIWYPVEGSSLRLPVCRTGALPSELTGQILVRAARLELALRRVRVGYSATRIPPAWSRRRESNAGFVRTGDALCH